MRLNYVIHFTPFPYIFRVFSLSVGCILLWSAECMNSNVQKYGHIAGNMIQTFLFIDLFIRIVLAFFCRRKQKFCTEYFCVYVNVFSIFDTLFSSFHRKSLKMHFTSKNVPYHWLLATGRGVLYSNFHTFLPWPHLAVFHLFQSS